MRASSPIVIHYVYDMQRALAFYRDVFAVEASAHFPDVEIIEMHHEKKLDSPSGTSIQTARMMEPVRDKHGPDQVSDRTELVTGCRGGTVNGTPIHSVRLPGLLAHQLVLFGGPGQTLTLRHDVMDRTSFIAGVLLAVRKVTDLDTLVIGLEHLI